MEKDLTGLKFKEIVKVTEEETIKIQKKKKRKRIYGFQIYERILLNE